MRVVVDASKNTMVLRGDVPKDSGIPAVPGARYSETRGAWVFPATAFCAYRIGKTIGTAPLDAAAFALFYEAEEALAGRLASGLSPQTRLRPWRHQLGAYRFGLPRHAFAFWGAVGSGKTKVTLDLITNRRSQHNLVICPVSALSIWPQEAATHAARPVEVIHPTRGKNGAARLAHIQRAIVALGGQRPFIVVLNSEAVWREPLAAWVLSKYWDTVVLDELHRGKSPDTKLSAFLTRLAECSRYRVGLTGTPIHRLDDLFAEFRFLDPGLFGQSYGRFFDRYCIYDRPDPTKPRVICANPKNEADLWRRIRAITFQVRKDELDLPPLVEIPRIGELSPAVRRVYDDLETQLMAELARERIRVPNRLALFTRLRQVTSGFLPTTTGGIQELGHEKADLLAGLLDEMESGEAVVVFGAFDQDLRTIRQVANRCGRSVLEWSGKRKEYPRWQAGEAEVLAVNTRAGSMAQDLTRARYAIFYAHPMSLIDYEQCLGRTHRVLQKRHVTVFHLLLRGTIDRYVLDGLQQRKDVATHLYRSLKEKHATSQVPALDASAT